jgi:hypothetical protein
MAMDDREFEARARAAFDESVAALDAATRSRLTQARHRALAARGARPAWQAFGVPAGAAAAAVLAAAMWMGREAPAPAPALSASAQGEMFDLLSVGDDLELLQEDPEFYAWAATMEDVG